LPGNSVLDGLKTPGRVLASEMNSKASSLSHHLTWLLLAVIIHAVLFAEMNFGQQECMGFSYV
jgi:hypothetical protein